MEYKSVAKGIKLDALDDLFKVRSDSQVLDANDADKKLILEISRHELHPFHNHPFKVKDDVDMAALVESIMDKGVLTPLLVRPRAEGGYEIISGHRRTHAAALAGVDMLPAIVEQMDDDEAAIHMVDSNLQREHILPSEKAWAYRIKLDSMKRQGQRSDLTCAQVAHKLDGAKSRDILADQVGESKDKVRRYVRLTYLFSPLLDMVDADQLKLIPAVEVSYLDEDAQKLLYSFMLRNKIEKISMDQAKLLRGSKDSITDAELADIFDTESRIKGLKSDTITLNIPMECIPERHRKTPPDGELLRRIEETIRSYYESVQQ